jgi:peptide/nickel transport system substrate-binding protein
VPSEKRLILSLITSFLLAIVGCQQPASPGLPATQSLTIPVFQPLSSYDPLIADTTMSARLSELIFDGLVRLDNTLQVQPHLAASWELSDDRRTWIFHLQKGVRFHDGVELTADDVKFTFDRLKAPSLRTTYSYNLEEIDDIIVKDRYTVQIHLKDVVSSFLSDLIFAILPEHLFVKGTQITKSDFGFHPIGTGPFKVISSSEEGSILQVNKNYFLGRPKLDRLIVKVYSSQKSAWAGLLRGESNFFSHPNPTDFQRLLQVSEFQVYMTLEPYYYLLALNLQAPIFRDRAVRQALNYAINKEAIVEKALMGYGQVAAGTIYPGSWGYDSSVKPYPYDPQKALSLLERAGWQDHDGDHFLDKNGHQFGFAVYSNRGDDLKQRVLLLVQQQLFALGIKMDVRFFDAVDTDFLFHKRFEAHFPEIDASGDPDLNYKFWHSSQIDGGFNVGSYRNPKVDQLLEAGRHAFDQAERKSIYTKFQHELKGDPPGIFLFWADYLVGVNKRIKGVKISPAGPFANIREWYVDEDQHPGS